MPCSLSGVKPLPRPLPTPSEFYFPETQPPELPRQPSSDSPTGSTQPWSDSPAVPKPPSSSKEQTVALDRRHPRTDWSQNAAQALPTKTPDSFVGRGRPHTFVGRGRPDFSVGRGRLDFFVGRGPWTKVRWGSDTSQAHRRVCSKGKVLSAFFLD
ncbi:unnamed protein product [Dicrocoelium dendriticum]|nr:unnamed protein product [Dicrocoelium dendriticum]